MAVTSESQIYNIEKAKLAASSILESRTKINNAIDLIKSAKNYCTTDYFSIDGVSEPRNRLIVTNSLLNLVSTLMLKASEDIIRVANDLRASDQKEYNDYVEAKAEEERIAAEKAEAERRAEAGRERDEHNYGSNGPNTSNLPFQGSGSGASSIPYRGSDYNQERPGRI